MKHNSGLKLKLTRFDGKDWKVSATAEDRPGPSRKRKNMKTSKPSRKSSPSHATAEDRPSRKRKNMKTSKPSIKSSPSHATAEDRPSRKRKNMKTSKPRRKSSPIHGIAIQENKKKNHSPPGPTRKKALDDKKLLSLLDAAAVLQSEYVDEGEAGDSQTASEPERSPVAAASDSESETQSDENIDVVRNAASMVDQVAEHIQDDLRRYIQTLDIARNLVWKFLK